MNNERKQVHDQAQFWELQHLSRGTGLLRLISIGKINAIIGTPTKVKV